MGILDYFFERKQQPVSQPVQTKAYNTPLSFPIIGNGGVNWLNDNSQTYITNGYQSNPIVYSIIKLITDKLSSVPFYLYEVKNGQKLKSYKSLVLNGNLVSTKALITKEQSLKEVENHPILTLLDQSNESQSFSDFLKNAIGYKLLTGNSYIYGSRPEFGAGNIRIAVKLSNGTTSNWLYKNGDDYTWSSSFRTLKIQLPDGNYSENRPNRWDWVNDFWHTLEFETIGVVNLTFNKLDVYIYPSYNNPNGWSGTGSYIRELSIGMQTANTNNYEGEIYKIQTSKNYTETYEDLEPIYGEFANVGNTNQLLINTSTGQTYTQSWYREGKTESKPLLQLAGTSILNQYREPYLQFTGSVRGDFDFGKVYNINSLSGRFMPFKATLNLKNDVSNIELFELIPESDLQESTYTFIKKANLGNSIYNTVKIVDVDTNRPKPNRSYY